MTRHEPHTPVAAQRYLWLVDDLIAEAEGSGARAAAARRLGVSSAYVHKLATRERVSVGLQVIERAACRLQISRSYFFEPADGRPTYRDYPARCGGDAREALRQWERTTRVELTNAEREALARLPIKAAAAWKYSSILQIMRSAEVDPP